MKETVSKSKNSISIVFIIIAVFAVFSSGCSPTVSVSHDPLRRISSSKSGKVLVKPFVDRRPKGETEYLGSIRNGYGITIAHHRPPEGTVVVELITEYICESLEKAGYQCTIDDGTANVSQADFHRIVEGELRKLYVDGYWWLDCNATIFIKTIEPATNNLVWEKEFKGYSERSNANALIRMALTDVLNQAVAEFASDRF